MRGESDFPRIMDPEIQKHLIKAGQSPNRAAKPNRPMVDLKEVDRRAEKQRQMNNQLAEKAAADAERKAERIRRQSVNSTGSHPDIPGQTEADRKVWEDAEKGTAEGVTPQPGVVEETNLRPINSGKEPVEPPENPDLSPAPSNPKNVQEKDLTPPDKGDSDTPGKLDNVGEYHPAVEGNEAQEPSPGSDDSPPGVGVDSGEVVPVDVQRQEEEEAVRKEKKEAIKEATDIINAKHADKDLPEPPEHIAAEGDNHVGTHGVTIDPVGEGDSDDADDLENFTVAELREEATSLKIKGRSELTTRDELIPAIREARKS